jgi:mycoredoxin
MNTDARAQEPITLYLRPRCPCSYVLRYNMRRRGLTFTEINIWKDPAAAAAVRAVADGNETVPTVHVAGEWLVNPRVGQVEKLARPPVITPHQ